MIARVREPNRTSSGRRLKAFLAENRWALLGAAALATLGLGMVGFAHVPDPSADRKTSRDLLYRALQLFVLESGAVPPPVPWQLDFARLGAPAITALATAGLANRVVQELRAVAGRNIGRRKNHVIICGLGKKGKRLAAEFARERKKVVAIEMEEGGGRTLVRSRGWVTLKGDAKDPEMLRRAGLKSADRLIAVCGSDGTNAEIAVAARSIVENERTTDLPALIHIANRELKSLLAPIEGSGDDKLNARLINVYELGAEAMLAMAPSFRADEDDRRGLLIVGLGEVGQCLAVKAAKAWSGPAGEPLRLHAIDLAAEKKVNALRSLHPELDGRWELTPLEWNINEHANYQRGGFLANLAEAGTVGAIYICIDDDPLALQTALTMRKTFSDPHLAIKVRTADGRAGLASVLDGTAFPGIHAFGLLDVACTPRIFGAEQDRRAGARS